MLMGVQPIATRPDCIVRVSRARRRMGIGKTYKVVVLAADSLLAAGVAANAKNVDRGAVKTDGDVEALEVYREQAQEGRGKDASEVDRVCLKNACISILIRYAGSTTYRLDLVAALDRTRRAILALLEGGGGRKNGEGSERERGEAREHHLAIEDEGGGEECCEERLEGAAGAK